jgi:type IV secretory pathway VirB2 component (pilin)
MTVLLAHERMSNKMNKRNIYYAAIDATIWTAPAAFAAASGPAQMLQTIIATQTGCRSTMAARIQNNQRRL